MQNIHQILNLYLNVLNTHLQNNNVIWEQYLITPNETISDQLVQHWMTRYVEINNQFADQLFQATLNIHSEALRYFDQHLMPMPTVNDHLH